MSGPFIKKIPPCREGRQGEAHLVRMAIAGFHLVINSERIKTFQTGLCIIVFFNFFVSEIKNSTLLLRADKIHNGFSCSLSFFFFFFQVACVFLVTSQGSNQHPLLWKASLNCWTAREVPRLIFTEQILIYLVYYSYIY